MHYREERFRNRQHHWSSSVARNQGQQFRPSGCGLRSVCNRTFATWCCLSFVTSVFTAKWARIVGLGWLGRVSFFGCLIDWLAKALVPLVCRYPIDELLTLHVVILCAFVLSSPVAAPTCSPWEDVSALCTGNWLNEWSLSRSLVSHSS